MHETVGDFAKNFVLQSTILTDVPEPEVEELKMELQPIFVVEMVLCFSKTKSRI